MNNQIELLFALLRTALAGEAPTQELARYLTEENVATVLPLAKAQDIGQILADTLAERLPEDSEVLAKFRKLQMLALFRHESLCREQEEICRVLEEAGIRHVPLKGAVIRAFYPEGYWRTSCDIDILIDEENLDSAIAALTERLSYTASARRAYHDVSLHSPTGVHLELHFHIKEGIAHMDRVLSQVFSYTKPVNGLQYRLLQTNEFLLFHVVAHMAYHMASGGCGIKPFIDLYLLEHALVLDRDALKGMLLEAHLFRFYESAHQLADVWLGGAPHTDLTREMELFILKGGLYGTRESKLTVTRGQSRSKLGYLFSCS